MRLPGWSQNVFLKSYITLMNAMADAIRKAGGQIHLQTPIKEIVIENSKAKGILLADGRIQEYDAVVATVQLPIFQRLIPQAGSEYLDYLKQTEYLGIVAPLLVLDRPLTNYWTLNITDDSIPFTGVIETTSYIDP